MSCAWGNYHKYRLSERDCLPLMWPASLWGLLWQLVDGVTENKWGVFSRCWYGEEGANWVHRKGAFPKQWEDCALLSEAEQIYSKIAQIWAQQHLCVSPPCSEALLPVWLSISAISVQHVAPVGLACGGMPSQKAGLARDSVLPALTVISKIVCVPVLCWMLHCAVDPALQQIQSDSRNWVKCDHYSRPPPSHNSWTVHQGSLYNSTLFWLLCHAGIARGGLSRGWKLFSPFFLFPLSVSRSLPCWLSPFLSLQFILVIGTGHCECIGKARVLIRMREKKKVYLIAVFFFFLKKNINQCFDPS